MCLLFFCVGCTSSSLLFEGSGGQADSSKLRCSFFLFPSSILWITTDCFNISTTVYISFQVTHYSFCCHLIVVQHGPRCDSMKTADTAHQFDWHFNKWLSFSLPISPNRSRTSALNHCSVHCDWWRHITDTFPMYICKCVSVHTLYDHDRFCLMYCPDAARRMVAFIYLADIFVISLTSFKLYKLQNR